MQNLILSALLVAALAVLALVILWQVIAPKTDPRIFAREFVARRIDYLLRAWAFLGPRLTHKPTVAMVLANVAVLFGLDAGHFGTLELLIWAAANLMFPPWDDLPNETLAGPGGRR